MSFRRSHLQGVGVLPFGRLGDPVAVGQSLCVSPDRRRLPRQSFAQLLLSGFDLFLTTALFVTQP